MSKEINLIKIFIGSPSDVTEERERLTKVANELNRTMGNDKNIVIELVKWETHVTPDMGRAQSIINKQIGPYDIFVGIMWKRFGKPTGKADSGTQEEFNDAYDCWKKSGRPRIMFYFNQAPYTLHSVEDVDQLRKVMNFRSQLQDQGLFWEYAGPDQF